MGSCYEHVLVACEPFLVGHILSRYHIYSSDRAHRSPKGRRHRQSKISASTCFATTTSILFSLPLISGSRDLAKQKKKKKRTTPFPRPQNQKEKRNCSTVSNQRRQNRRRRHSIPTVLPATATKRTKNKKYFVLFPSSFRLHDAKFVQTFSFGWACFR